MQRFLNAVITAAAAILVTAIIAIAWWLSRALISPATHAQELVSSTIAWGWTIWMAALAAAVIWTHRR